MVMALTPGSEIYLLRHLDRYTPMLYLMLQRFQQLRRLATPTWAELPSNNDYINAPADGKKWGNLDPDSTKQPKPILLYF